MGKSRISDDEYAEMAADYETNPPTAAEVTSVELNPAYLPTGRPNKALGQQARHRFWRSGFPSHFATS